MEAREKLQYLLDDALEYLGYKYFPALSTLLRISGISLVEPEFIKVEDFSKLIDLPFPILLQLDPIDKSKSTLYALAIGIRSDDRITYRVKGYWDSTPLSALENHKESEMSFTLGEYTISQVKGVPTACINTKTLEMSINSEFVLRHADSAPALAGLILHELMHYQLDPYREYPLDDVYGFAEDMMINSLIHALNYRLSFLQRRYYKDAKSPLHGLLKSNMSNKSKEEVRKISRGIIDIYQDGLYPSYYHSYGTKYSINDIAQALPHKHVSSLTGGPGDPVLLGNHNRSNEQDEEEEEAHKKVSGALQQDMEKLPASKQAGSGVELMQRILQLKRVRRNKDDFFRKAMERSLTGKLIEKIIGGFTFDTSQSPVPIYLTRRDLALIGAGITPVFFGSRDTPDELERGSVHIYIDVSGSVEPYIPWFYGFVVSMEPYLSEKIFLFSNKIDEITKKELKEGKLRTTGGTDFDCIAGHFLEQKDIKKCIILTDGYAGIQPELAKRMKEEKEVYALLTPEHSKEGLKEFVKKQNMSILPKEVAENNE